MSESILISFLDKASEVYHDHSFIHKVGSKYIIFSEVKL